MEHVKVECDGNKMVIEGEIDPYIETMSKIAPSGESHWNGYHRYKRMSKDNEVK